MAASTALLTDGLTVSFGGFTAVDTFSIVVEEGEIRVILGPNGAGKTTLMDLISGKTASTGGKVRLFGQDVTNWPEHRIARAGLGRKFQIPSVFRELTVRQNLEVAASDNVGVFANLRLGRSKREQAKIDGIVEMAGLEEVIGKTAGELSHGQVQWLEIGMLLAQDARLILLDEPTAGMTAAETRKTARIVNDLKGKHTIMVVEHDMAFVRDIAEKITVMHLGKLLAHGPIAAIEQDEKVREAYLGSGGIH